MIQSTGYAIHTSDVSICFISDKTDTGILSENSCLAELKNDGPSHLAI